MVPEDGGRSTAGAEERETRARRRKPEQTQGIVSPRARTWTHGTSAAVVGTDRLTTSGDGPVDLPHRVNPPEACAVGEAPTRDRGPIAGLTDIAHR